MKPDEKKKTTETPEAGAALSGGAPGAALSDEALDAVSGGSGVPEVRLVDDSYDEWIKWEPK